MRVAGTLEGFSARRWPACESFSGGRCSAHQQIRCETCEDRVAFFRHCTLILFASRNEQRNFTLAIAPYDPETPARGGLLHALPGVPNVLWMWSGSSCMERALKLSGE